MEKPERRSVIGLPVDCVDYDAAIEYMQRLAKDDRPHAVAAANTHLAAVSRADRGFGEVMDQFSLVNPDGMPLVWHLNLHGAGLHDRVYGPYLMRETLKATPAPWRHYFFGGSEKCLENLQEAIQRDFPKVQIAGAFSPPFRAWTGEDQEDFAQRIRDSGADFIWVCLGGEKQERWIIENRCRFSRGVFVGIGDAFALLAGERPFTPRWMQRCGLTWVYRLYQDPKRLFQRYLRYNSLFLFYTCLDLATGRSGKMLRQLKSDKSTTSPALND